MANKFHYLDKQDVILIISDDSKKISNIYI